MEMFVWHSELLKQYSRGWIIVMATDVEDARQRARDSLDAWVQDRYSWLTPDEDSDDAEQVEKFKELLEADLAKEPETHRVLFINGSE